MEERTQFVRNGDANVQEIDIWNIVFERYAPENGQTRALFDAMPENVVKVLRLDKNKNLQWSIQYSNHAHPNSTIHVIPIDPPNYTTPMTSLTLIVERIFGAEMEQGAIQITWPGRDEPVEIVST